MSGGSTGIGMMADNALVALPVEPPLIELGAGACIIG
jgi:hypothetical protein